MDTMRVCKECGAPLPDDAPEGLCPKCLMKIGIGTEGGIPAGSSGEKKPAPSPAEIARHFPQLEILELLGQGGMGMVYKARQRQLDRLVALKILPLEAGRDPAFAERFTREAQALARLNHPNIVSVYDFGQTDGLYYFLMEFVDGANLRQMEHSRRFTPKEALTIVPRICEALQYAHDEGIVHRDIKPENILIDKKGRVKIADFGLAKLLGRAPQDLTLTGARDLMGTPHYMAPEQVEHPQEVDHRADIYSLGVVFYEMLTGELPIGRFAAPSQKVHVDVRLDEIVLRSLEKEPARRYQHASEVKTDVETISGVIGNLPPHIRNAIGFEYKSKRTLFGWPLLHVVWGIDPATGKSRVARGIVAIGARAKGLVAMGGLAFGGFAFGGVACGVIPVGGLSLGLFAAGGFALGLILAYGGLAVAPIAMGGLALGYLAFGGGAFGVHALGGNASDPVAREFFLPWASEYSGTMTVLYMLLLAIGFLISFGVPALLMRRVRAQGLSASAAPPPVQKPDRFWRWFAVGIAALIAIPIGLAILGILLSIAIPAYFKARQEAQQRKAMVEQVIVQYDWQDLAREGRLLGGVPVEVDGRSALRIENTNNAPLQLALYKIENPPITSQRFAVSGEIQYENVEGDGYLEMWSQFEKEPRATEGLFFSRTLDASGPMGKISGTSSWRAFTLPFRQSRDASPYRLHVNVVLPGRGVVYIGPPTLVQFVRPDESAAARPATNVLASVESWNPSLASGEKPDPQAVLHATRELTNEGRHEEALQRYLWYHKQSRIDSTASLINALSDWVELGRRYPKAKQALLEIRDHATREFHEGRGYSALFAEISQINDQLGDEEATYTLYMFIQKRDPTLARQCYFYAETLLVQNGQYQLCAQYMGDPQRRFATLRQSFEMQRDMHQRMRSLLERTVRPSTSVAAPPHPSEMMIQSTNDRFVGGVGQLIEILVGIGRIAEADQIREQALAVLDDPRLKSAVTDAQERVRLQRSPAGHDRQ
jgi:predicted Ser/Thr protein kinase